ncbi:Na+/H+ antiporter [Actinophytocola xanthii]|uniref:Na+/H+ antiporter n=1 Tax=Actinophytocola xanthii TaxID=1912961 RepID=A0A1Q8CTZ3_9PSEU|nr:Na+/H+ antiporter [Actinophytocola xanthii]OLF17826.1 Na+/H+ antiporter [Actinophytocola xanthii]
MYDPKALLTLVLIGAAILVGASLARRSGQPVVLLTAGVLLSLTPALHDFAVAPEVVILLFLPAILYWESLTTSLREIRANLRVVLLTAIVLVLITVLTVAVVAHALGLPWPMAFVLGAVVAPTDATAVASVGGRLSHRQLTTLRAESLINDGTALVVFAIAVSVATGERELTWYGPLGESALSYLGGGAVGLAVAWLSMLVRRVVNGTLLESGISVLTPFVAFLLAEEIHASGVLAVVVAGLALSQLGPRSISARTRLQTYAFWQVTTFLLNAALFVLVGLQLLPALRELDGDLDQALWLALAVAGTVIGTRLLWAYTVPYLIRAIDRRPQQRLRRVGARHRLPNAWAGFRGAVSLAAALAVPGTLPHRDEVIVVTFGVILVTLVVQGLTLPAVLRWANLPADRKLEEEYRLALRLATEAGLAALPEAADRLGVSEGARGRLTSDYEAKLHRLSLGEDDQEEPDERMEAELLRNELLPIKRATVVALRDQHVISDTVLLRVQALLDAEENRINPPSTVD